MGISGMLEELPKASDAGTKRNSKGYKRSWTGYKLHIDSADGGIPVSASLASTWIGDSKVVAMIKVLIYENEIEQGLKRKSKDRVPFEVLKWWYKIKPEIIKKITGYVSN